MTIEESIGNICCWAFCSTVASFRWAYFSFTYSTFKKRARAIYIIGGANVDTVSDFLGAIWSWFMEIEADSIIIGLGITLDNKLETRQFFR